MMRVLKRLASLRLTLAAMLALAVLSVLGSRGAVVGVDATAVPLIVLAVNLVAALISNRTLRTQTGLLVFHVGLLVLFVLIGLSVATRFDGHVEVVQGSRFDAAIVEMEAQGWLHNNRLDRIEFRQGDIRVGYLPGLLRQRTRSEVEYVADDGRLRRVTVGDKHGFEVDGYRFLATFNKGFALVLNWQGADGSEVYGSVNFLSFPRYDWKQVTTWTTPAGEVVRLELEFDRPYFDDSSAWSLQATDIPYRVEITSAAGVATAIREGEATALQAGTVRVSDLRLWMGYRIDYLPFLPWMFVASLVVIAGLALHFASRYLPRAEGAEVRAGEGGEGHVARA